MRPLPFATRERLVAAGVLGAHQCDILIHRLTVTASVVAAREPVWREAQGSTSALGKGQKTVKERGARQRVVFWAYSTNNPPSLY
jgi:hypothetical protein